MRHWHWRRPVACVAREREILVEKVRKRNRLTDGCNVLYFFGFLFLNLRMMKRTANCQKAQTTMHLCMCI